VYAPVCGNGIIEAGEVCDDASACCSNTCQLTNQCSAGVNNANPCCTPQCTFAPTSTACDNGNGFCANAVCQDSICTGERAKRDTRGKERKKGEGGDDVRRRERSGSTDCTELGWMYAHADIARE
jgi:hypothetical protein